MRNIIFILCICLFGCAKPSNEPNKVSAASATSVNNNANYQDAYADSKELKSPEEIDNLVSSIPNLKQGLVDNDLTVKWVNYAHYTDDDIKLSDGMNQKGDINYQFFTNTPKDGLPCPLSNTFIIDKRGNQWIAQSKTANYLLTGNCSLPKSNGI